MSTLVIGEALIDEVAFADGSCLRGPGGSMLNVAIGLRRLGRTVRLVTDFGLDPDGEILAEYTASNGLELWLRADAERTNPTSVSRTVIGEDGVSSQSLTFTWDIQDIPESGAFQLDLQALAPTCLAFGSAACHVEPGASKVRNWVSHLRDSATIVYDPNVSACLIDDRANARDRVEDFVALADIVKASDEDVARLYGARADSGDIAAGWLSLGPSLVIVTRGTADTLLYPRSGSPIRIPSQQVDVIDTAGAGDSFFAALIDGLTRISLDGAAHRDNLNDISRTHLQSLGAYASTAASLTASRRGAVPPTREELAAVNGRYRAM